MCCLPQQFMVKMILKNLDARRVRQRELEGKKAVGKVRRPGKPHDLCRGDRPGVAACLLISAV